MKRGRNKLSIRDRTSVKAVYKPTTTFIVSRTARYTSLAYGLTILVLEQLVRSRVSQH